MNEISQARLFIAGSWVTGKEAAKDITSPFTGEKVSVAEQASIAQMDQALKESVEAFEKFKHVSRHTRSKLLFAIAQGLEARRSDLVSSMIREAGKPKALSEGEVGRAIVTFTVAAEEAKRYGGEIVPLDIETNGRAYAPAVSVLVPRGPVLAITPFNFPLNLVAHKVAPALAVGASVVLKPAPHTPGCSVILAEIFEKAASQVSDARESVPLSTLQVVHCSNDVASHAVSSPRVQTLSFTGSNTVGWMLQGKATRKKVALELGGNASVIIAGDCKEADLERAVARCVFGAFAYAGQVCISVQKIFVHESIYPQFEKLFLEATAKVKSGDPANADTLSGPIIDSKAADRVMAWIDEAKQSGAKVLAGGGRKQNLIEPTVLTGVKPTLKIACEEAFGPIVILESYSDFSKTLTLINDSQFGLQAGIFTDSQKAIDLAFATLDVGGLIVNDVPTYRQDNMPYGGVKESGLGREGLKYAMEDFSERRTLVSFRG